MALTIALVAAFTGRAALADAPQTINHQGVVKVDGVPFDGAGQFKFAVVDAAGVNLWTNDNSNLVLNGVPNAHEDVTVNAGVYSVLLGGTGPAYTMTALAPSVFNAGDTKLRIWFNDGVNGFQQLTPDHALAASPYSHQAAFQPPIGSIIAWHKNLPGVPALPDGWIECTNPSGTATINASGSPLNGQLIPPLNDTPPVGYTGGGRFLRGGMGSGNLQDATFVYDGNSGAGQQYRTSHANNWAFEHDGIRTFDVNQNNGSPACWCANTPVESAIFAYVRPTNMSVVWIMRVK
ncbi:MAG: hypothetical protein HOP29_15735 [Phycisphaerales bacterium]|nr:hypothetical protein [Phycisphaerales bacterium]